MDKQIKNMYIIASISFAIAGIIFLCISIFGEEKENWMLCTALASIILSNLFNIIRIKSTKKEEIMNKEEK